jgi:predicted nucleic acid-binding protein
MILVDSTKFISWMRAGRNPVTVLESALRARALVSCGIVRIEVLRGIVKPAVKREIAGLFEAIPDIAIDTAIVADAAETAWKLDRKGRVLPVTDLVIASCAKRLGATVVTEDPHFRHIPGLASSAELA